VARRGDLSPEDADDLAATVKLALIENDYAALRAFQGRCSLATYVASIAHRLLADEWMRVSGRWRPSAQSKRAGEGAVLLEMLVVRDRKTLDEALPLVQKLDSRITHQAATALLAALPKRADRPRLVALDGVPEQEAAASDVEERVLAHERAGAAATTNAVVREALAGLPADDRVLLRLRFGNGMRVPAIARAWQCEPQILYRRIETLVRRLRQQLVGAGIDAVIAAQLIGSHDGNLEFGWTESEKTAAVQTTRLQRGGAEESMP